MSSRPLAAHVAVGERAARLIEQEARLRAGSVRTIYNGVPDDHIEPLPRLAEGLVVGSVGRLDEQKAYDVLIAALPSLPDVTAGSRRRRPARSELEELARDHGVADRVILTGWKAEARRYLGGFDVFVLPSRSRGSRCRSSRRCSQACRWWQPTSAASPNASWKARRAQSFRPMTGNAWRRRSGRSSRARICGCRWASKDGSERDRCSPST